MEATRCFCGATVGIWQRLSVKPLVSGPGQTFNLCKRCRTSLTCRECKRSAGKAGGLVSEEGNRDRFLCLECELKLARCLWKPFQCPPHPDEVAFCALILLCSGVPFPAKCVCCMESTSDHVDLPVEIPPQNSTFNAQYRGHILPITVPCCRNCSEIKLNHGRKAPRDICEVSDYADVRVHNDGVGASAWIRSGQLGEALFNRVREKADRLAGRPDVLTQAIVEYLAPHTCLTDNLTQRSVEFAQEELRTSPQWLKADRLAWGLSVREHWAWQRWARATLQ